MSDYDRFLKMARDHAADVARIAARLLKEGKIGRRTRDALGSAAEDLLYDAYQAGRCESQGVEDLRTPFRVAATASSRRGA